ncbi:hypothetical protein PRN20_21415 [Devosia sp. ZB163]|uniref:hypothetical protein n=1 Tax=Devosia sp. ZB163 TaxID=3025938 RepID=UPI0023615A33|nr:hypothetical protein [Devosia sp. ZB163]MDC9826301.1 hypothetical protein [Devosia sp. ZB163]
MPTETQLAEALALIRRGASAEAESLLRAALEAAVPSAEARTPDNPLPQRRVPWTRPLPPDRHDLVRYLG